MGGSDEFTKHGRMDRVCRDLDGDPRRAQRVRRADRALGDNYYVATPSGYLLFDVTGWGWIMLIWGIILALVGLALLNGASWARWVSIVFVSINVFGQLGFLGNTNDTVWLLITLTLNIIILYALIVRWHESQRELETR